MGAALAYPLETLCRYCRGEYGDHLGRRERCPGTTLRDGTPRKTTFYPAFTTDGRDAIREDRIQRLRAAIESTPRGLYSAEAAVLLGCPHNTAAKYLDQLQDAGLVESYLVPRSSYGPLPRRGTRGGSRRPRRYYRVATEPRS